MAFSLADHLALMVRRVDNLDWEGQPAKAVVASRVYDTTPADLWDALTRAERIKRWFAPVTGDLALGGRYQVENNAGGTITECVPDKKIALTWEFGPAVSWVIVTLIPDGAGTRLELQHIAHLSPHWDQYGPGAVGVGWDLGFMGLSRHLAEPEADVPAETVAGWFGSDEAKSFIRTASDDWGRADIVAGEPREHALATAEATRKFYSGEPAE
ncbi:SRPBCC family protein [Devosia riboflavina]|nr:SRPBCC family protein [Devosia riboflavina]